jgi:hypothetical protein
MTSTLSLSCPVSGCAHRVTSTTAGEYVLARQAAGLHHRLARHITAEHVRGAEDDHVAGDS